MIIGDRLRAVREKKKLSHVELESKAGLPKTLICRIESGHTVPPLPILERLAEALDVPLVDLFCDPENLAVSFSNLAVSSEMEVRPKRVGTFGWIRENLWKPN